MFSHAKSLKKVEALQKRALRFLYDDYNSPSEEILKKSGKFCMELNRLRYLCIEIYKTINNINPGFMKEIFQDSLKSVQTKSQCSQSQSG